LKIVVAVRSRAAYTRRRVPLIINGNGLPRARHAILRVHVCIRRRRRRRVSRSLRRGVFRVASSTFAINNNNSNTALSLLCATEIIVVIDGRPRQRTKCTCACAATKRVLLKRMRTTYDAYDTMVFARLFSAPRVSYGTRNSCVDGIENAMARGRRNYSETSFRFSKENRERARFDTSWELFRVGDFIVLKISFREGRGEFPRNSNYTHV